MCGIAAIFAYGTHAPAVDREELRRIRDRMTRRGPDAAGEWHAPDGRIGLAHRRLSIIDLSERGAQPMRTADGALTITFNGEIYNYKTLRAELERDGARFHSDSDTEVVLQMYARRGPAMLRDLRGMFAFCLWDERRGELFLARDPYGIKPLYYADDGSTVRAASQVKALLAGGKVSAETDPAGAVGFLLFGSVPEPFTIRSAIRALPAGHYAVVSAKGVSEPVGYFRIAQVFADARGADGGITESEALARVRDALRDSVAHHMIADVPVGAFLSAGIDSGTLVGLARDTGVEDIQTMTLAFEEYRGLHDDESPLAAEVARHYGTRHTERLLGRAEFDADLDDILDVMDQPSIDGVNTYFVSKLAAGQGLKVALSGLGGDELCGGYNTFIDVPSWVRRFAIPSRLPLAGRAFRAAFDAFLGRSSGRSPKAAAALTYGGTYPGAWYLRRGVFLPWELDGYLDADFVREGLASLRFLDIVRGAMTPDPGTAFGRVAALEASLYMRNQLLRDSDWAGMAHSIELRVPFVDAALLGALAPLLLRFGPVHRKHLIAQSPLRPLPDNVRTRPKTGFQVPVHAWLEGNPRIDDWKRIPSLAREGAPWARRWAYTLIRRLIARG